MIAKQAFMLMGALCLCMAAICAGEDRVELQSGDVLIGQVVERNATAVIMQHPVLGLITVPMERVDKIEVGAPEDAKADKPAATKPVEAKPAAEVPAEVQAAVKEEPPTQMTEPVAPPKPKIPWKFRLTVGFSARESNVDTRDVNTSFEARYADEDDRWNISASYFLSTRKNDVSRQDVHFVLQKDWLVPESPWFWFFEGHYDHDDFKSWEHRGSAHGGVGYDLSALLGVDVRLRLGFGVTREFGGVDPNTRPESLVGSEVNWKINPQNTLAFSTQFYPSIDASGEIRITTSADWTMKFTPELGFRLGLRNEYDSSEPPGFEKNDLRVFGSVVFDF
ncbi:MAG: DUF481 domain-containing protein [Planctomycetes bacterium]|nr:DUF481 domain-containing protein [Planctomycetota bacterium]